MDRSNSESKANMMKIAGELQNDMNYDERLFHYTYASQDNDPHFLQFRLLQKISLAHMQNELAKVKERTMHQQKVTEPELERLRVILSDYATAVRDYSYFEHLSELSKSQSDQRRRDLVHFFGEIGGTPRDPYNSRFCELPTHSELPNDPLRDFLKNHLPKKLTWTQNEIERRDNEYLDGLPPDQVSSFVDKLARFIIAFVGGASLVIPMLVMNLNQNQTKSLITTSVAVVLFAAAMSMLFRASNSETLAATATYAAVLVVFVGTSSSLTQT